ncbi:MAG: LytR C-terminal domain-containing protein [Candidatus Levybacteria bacterium]|nr:LytR C-terminal domain-containing protein [Candidatus Levybacteria bacterium]
MPTVKITNSKATNYMAGDVQKGFASKSLLVIISFSILVLVAAGFAVYYFMQYQNSQSLLKDPQKATAQETGKIVDEVGRLIVLPQNEQPQIATVSDVNALKQQSFFAQAKNGDIVLIYTKAQKAVLYDPVQKKVVEVGPINVAAATPSASSAPVPAELRVALYNGTSVTGLSTTTERDLKAKLPTVIVVSKGNAAKDTYTKTTVVDVTGKQAAGAVLLAKTLNGEVGPLPEGESKPTNADFAIILGK